MTTVLEEMTGKRLCKDLVAYVVIISIILYVLKIAGITVIAYFCHLFTDSIYVLLFAITVTVLSIQKSYLFYSVIFERPLYMFTWQICCLIEVILTLQFGVSVLLNHKWFPCIPAAMASTFFICLFLDSVVYSYFAFCLAESNMDNRINPAEQTTPELAGSGMQETQTIENGEDQTAQNDSNIGKQFTHPRNIFYVSISILRQ